MTPIDDSTGVALGVMTFLLLVVLYLWTGLALSAVFRKSGEEAWKGWMPILNLVVLLRLGGLSGWLLLLALVPIAGWLLLWALLIVACYRINVAFGHGAGMTVLAALLLPLWASILGFGPDRWLGAAAPGPMRAGVPVSSAGRAARAFATNGNEYGADPAPSPFGPALVPAGGWSPPARVPPTPPPGATEPSAPGPLPAQDAPPARPLVQPPARTEAPAAEPPVFETEPILGRGGPGPHSADGGRWGGFDFGAMSELTDGVTAAEPAAPAPISAVPLRSAADGAEPPPSSPPVPPVMRLPATPAASADEEPWAPARSPLSDPDTISETSGAVSAVAGAPDAGTPRSATAAVSAQHSVTETAGDMDDGMDAMDAMDHTILTRRRRTAWSLIPPSGAPIALTAEVIIVGRKPVRDDGYPTAQLIAIDDGTVSKTHARLELRADRWYITDLGSTNGVLFATLMGTEVEATPGVETEAGERFYLGDAEVRLQRNER
ncbi:DUF5684 domain-containing protein [Microbacterium sp. zg.B48]|uniref:DUF5684 domain-containing protein n=1 Tax=Microbacterium sp. zg.B48 TaxID=2969408 RepID=UPI00214BEF62|nr:DUF5684 domain-containing protein [Microbacterium sp. zg.B48]MCR2763227.1 DUF5684 domain-containing protein [Microbacterium sp. zg.B48]